MKKIFFVVLFTFSTYLRAESKAQYRFEAATAPLAFLASWITVDLSYFYDSHWAFGPSIVRYNSDSTHGGMFLPTYNGNAFGAHALYTDNLLQDSYYLSFHAYSENYTSYQEAYLGHYDHQGTRANAVVGKRWVSLNYATMLGIGLENRNHNYTMVPDIGSKTDLSSNDTFLTIEFKMGLLF